MAPNGRLPLPDCPDCEVPMDEGTLNDAWVHLRQESDGIVDSVKNAIGSDVDATPYICPECGLIRIYDDAVRWANFQDSGQDPSAGGGDSGVEYGFDED